MRKSNFYILLQNLLKSWKITNARETVLSAHQYLSDIKRLQWQTTDSQHYNTASILSSTDFAQIKNPKVRDIFTLAYEREKQRQEIQDFVMEKERNSNLKITLQPMQIRTFIVDVVLRH